MIPWVFQTVPAVLEPYNLHPRVKPYPGGLTTKRESTKARRVSDETNAAQALLVTAGGD